MLASNFKTALSTRPATTLLLTEYTTVKETFECAASSQAGSLTGLANKVGTTGHRLYICRMLSDYDGCTLSFPVCSPVPELLSLLHDPVVTTKENLIPGYDVLAGKGAAGDPTPNTVSVCTRSSLGNSNEHTEALFNL